MSGVTQRCFYCSDSRGVEIDHFTAISRDVGRTFDWRNLALVCGACNRQKGNAATSYRGQRIFLDPTLDDSWEYFVLVTSTGLIATRWDHGRENQMGSYTLGTLPSLNHEAITEARRRVIRRLENAVERIVMEGDTTANRRDLLFAVDDDYFGVSRWFALRDGTQEPLFRDLHDGHPRIWKRFVGAATRL